MTRAFSPAGGGGVRTWRLRHTSAPVGSPRAPAEAMGATPGPPIGGNRQYDYALLGVEGRPHVSHGDGFPGRVAPTGQGVVASR